MLVSLFMMTVASPGAEGKSALVVMAAIGGIGFALALSLLAKGARRDE